MESEPLKNENRSKLAGTTLEKQCDVFMIAGLVLLVLGLLMYSQLFIGLGMGLFLATSGIYIFEHSEMVSKEIDDRWKLAQGS